MAGASSKWAGFSDEQSRALNELVARFDRAVAELKAPDRVVDRRGAPSAVRPRPGDVVRADAGTVVVLPHPRSAKGRAPIVVLVEGQPVEITADSGTVNDQATVTVTTVGAMEWWSTGTEWWGTAVGGSSGGGGTFTPTFGVPVDVALANAEGVATTLSRSDHVHRDRIPTGSENGFLSRRVYANASSTRVGTTFMGVTVLAAPASFTSMSDFADGSKFRIGLAPPGGSGSSGSRGTATSSGGSNPGAGGGAFREFWLSRAELVTLLAAGNITVAVGLGGAAVTGPTSSATSYTACTQGNNGSGPVTFGPWSCFQGGGGNGGGVANSARAGGAGGGWLSAAAGSGTTGTAASTGGAPLPIAAVQAPTVSANTALYAGGGCSAPAGTSGGTGNPSLFGGAAGSTNAGTADDPRPGGDSEYGGAGGGNGARATGGSAGVGGDGGLTGGRTSRAAAGTASVGAGARTGADGAPGADATDVWRGCGNGGAGGGGASSSNNSATGGNGGAGGFPGGGGGGGGTGNATTAGQTSTGGTSGAGGDGLLIIESY